MDLTGKIIAVLPMQEGQGKNGTWQKQEYVLEYDSSNSQYPKKVCFSLWGAKIGEANIHTDDELNVSIDIDCREWNGRWFNDIRAWRVSPLQKNANQPLEPPAMPNGMPTPPFQASDAPEEKSDNDDLPF